MSRFRIIDYFRNKIKNKSNELEITIENSAKIVGCQIFLHGKAKLKIGKNTLLRNAMIEIVDSSIIIGDNCMIGKDSYLSAKEDTSITIMDNCGLSRNAKVMTSDGHDILDAKQNKINFAKNIILNKSIWVADNVTILKGVTIEKNSVIAINSTVTKNVPANSIVAGNPAKIVKENISWRS